MSILTENDVVFFYGGIFSQWYGSSFIIHGTKYNCAEQFMMAMKAVTFNDDFCLKKILETSNPSIQKRFGRQVRNYNDKEWNEVRYNFVVQGNYAKFSQNGYLKKVLLNTGNKILVEASPYDTIWGIGMDANNPDRFDTSKWKGTNLLGKALMEVREKLKKESENI